MNSRRKSFKSRLKYLWVIIACLFSTMLFSKMAFSGDKEPKIIYAIKTMKYLMSAYEADRKDVEKMSDWVIEKTDLYSVDPKSGNIKKVFSDENTPYVILSYVGGQGDATGIVVSKGKRVFAHMVEYEISTDGQNRCKKIFDIMSITPPGRFLISNSGEKIAYQGSTDKKPGSRGYRRLFIHNSNNGELLNNIDLTSIFPDCRISIEGWMSDDKRLIVTVSGGDVHITPEECYEKAGSYIMNEDSTGLRKLSNEVFKGFLYGEGLTVLPTPLRDRVISETVTYDHEKREGPFSHLFISNLEGREYREIKLKSNENIIFPRISDDGSKIAYISYPSGSYPSYEYLLCFVDTAGIENKLLFRVQHEAGGRLETEKLLGIVGWLTDN